jgi:hypothetical protein
LPDDQREVAVSRADGAHSLVRMLDDLDRELGAPRAEDYAWADKALEMARVAN